MRLHLVTRKACTEKGESRDGGVEWQLAKQAGENANLWGTCALARAFLWVARSS
jgi:hypothetical protein